MLRISACLLLAALLPARGSDFIAPPNGGVSASVSQPHVTAQLISETPYVLPGRPFLVALHLHMDPGWHTYWINPGDAGLATMIKWTLPPGFTAGPIQWPVPEVHMMGPLTTYGYAGDVYLPVNISPPATPLSGPCEIKAHATWLVCQDECIPGQADLTLKLGDHAKRQADTGVFFFLAAHTRLPVADTRWEVSGAYVPHLLPDGNEGVSLTFQNRPGAAAGAVGHARFFPEQNNVLSCASADNPSPSVTANGFSLAIGLEQNGEKPDHLSGVLVSDQPLDKTGSKAVYLSSFPVTDGAATTPANPASAAVTESSDGHGSPLQPEPFLLAVLAAAFLGGLILNLMPCVLPVLSLKVFSLIRHAGENPRGAWRQGAAFTAGVVLSFWALAGVLLALRAAGGHLGWGFQMQSPGFVLALTFIFFLLALNLFGVFELGASLVGLDAKAAGRTDGLAGSFLNGALATLAATPCTAPFMGSALGFAAGQPAAISFLVFTALALGMAAPYLLLTLFPGALRFVPKPGAWMEAVKQFMGFLLLATVIFLVYVFGALVGEEQVPFLLATLLLAGVAAWIYGRWNRPERSGAARLIAVALALLLLVAAFVEGAGLATHPAAKEATAASDGWQPWSPGAVDSALAQERPAFVDFTAAWCLSCKVNERLALENESVRAAFAQKNVALFRADWTQADPAISATLQRYHRDGVPLYLLYSPGAKDAPQVLPEVLTPGLVLDAIKKS